MRMMLDTKYNVAAPRYTSYPTIPYWDTQNFSPAKWKESIRYSFRKSNRLDGISLYIHLPYCESLCTYCGCNTRITKNHQVEEPYIQSVLKEWALYRELFNEKPVIREIHLGGGTPTFFSPANLELLISGLRAGSIIHTQAEFSFEAHPANTTAAHLQTLFDLGFRRLSLGIQDFDPAVQRIINRQQSFNQVKLVTDAARSIGYTSVNFDLVYGLPLQTTAGLANTIQKLSELMPDRIAFYSYAHVPWIKPGQRLFTEHDLPNAALKRKLYQVGCRLFKQLGYGDIGMDHFALPTDSLFKAATGGSLFRNFMGYTHQYTQMLIGLGVSAISDTGHAYAQNSKTVEEYQRLLNEDKIPVIKGHLLTQDDLVIRHHIQNIMCKAKTSWEHPNQSCAALLAGIAGMGDLAEDKLIELRSQHLQVTPDGKRYLRNICMALDARLRADKRETQQFSASI